MDVMDLFGAPLIPGLDMRDDLVDDAAQLLLVERCLALDLSPFQFQGWEGKRLTRSFGWHYDFARGVAEKAAPIPDWLRAVRDRAARAFGRDPDRFEQALVIRYDPGAGIGWHRDRPQFDEVIGVSLDSPATMAFRRSRGDGRFDRIKLPLIPGSAYLLSGDARRGWQHGIASHDRRRFSLTFRSLA